MSIRRFITVRYLQWVVWIVGSLAWCSTIIRSASTEVFDWRLALTETGNLGWVMLIFTIYISLLQKLFRPCWLFNNLLPLRKHTGILAFLVACSHAALQMLRMGIIADASAMVRTAFSLQYAMVFGTVGILIMVPLFVTSTNRAMARMGYRTWKRLQRFVHLAFILSALHISLIGYFDDRGVEPGPLILLGVYAAGYTYLFAQKRWRPL